MSYRFAESLRAASLYDIYHCCVYRKKKHLNCSKNVEFYSKNKFENVVHLVGLLQEFMAMHGHLNVKNLPYNCWCAYHMLVLGSFSASAEMGDTRGLC